MEAATPNIDAERICPQCGNRADAGLIFCAECGAAIQPPFPLTQSTQDVGGPPVPSPTKRLVVAVVKGIRGIAVVVFILCPFRSGALILTFVVSVIVFLICHWLLTSLDKTYIDKNTKNGYWPPKPIDWTSSATTDNQQRAPNDNDDNKGKKKNSYRVDWRNSAP
jgi:hypothetical protein